MSTDHIDALIERAKNEPELQARFMGASGIEDMAAIATELGFEISTEDIADFVSDVELDEDQLERIAGGAISPDGFIVKTVIQVVSNW